MINRRKSHALNVCFTSNLSMHPILCQNRSRRKLRYWQKNHGPRNIPKVLSALVLDILEIALKRKNINIYLGGGNSNILKVHPENWGNDPIWIVMFQMAGNHQLVITYTWRINPSKKNRLESKKQAPNTPLTNPPQNGEHGTGQDEVFSTDPSPADQLKIELLTF